MSALPPSPTGDRHGGSSKVRAILIAMGAGVVLGLGFGAAAMMDAPVDVFLIAFGVALVAVPIVPVIVGAVRALGHPGEGWHRFWVGFLATLGIELVILIFTYGTCVVMAAQGEF